MSRPRSRAGAEWVRAPTETASTPVADAVRAPLEAHAAGRLQPGPAPDQHHRLAQRAGAHVVEQDPVGARRRAPPARPPGRRPPPRPGRSASRGAPGPRPPPAPRRRSARWLSFTRTRSNRPIRWLTPPPARTAAFSSAAHARRGLAGVEHRHRGAGGDVGRRSAWPPRRGGRAGSAGCARRAAPSARARRSRRRPTPAPGGRRRRRATSPSRPVWRSTSSPAARPASTPGRRATTPGGHPAVRRHEQVRGDVAALAEVLGERGGDHLGRRHARASMRSSASRPSRAISGSTRDHVDDVARPPATRGTR